MSEAYNKVYFVTGGGTGGHIYPAMAVADALSAEGNKVYYVGNKRNMEFELASKKGYKFLHVSIKGMPRGLNPKIFIWGMKLVKAILRSMRYIQKYKPDAVFATGGYVSAPMIFACIITKTPYMMHDCDAQPGLVTRKLAPHAKAVSLAFESAHNFINNKNFYVNGNPIRPQFKSLTKEEARKNLGLEDKLTLCVMGGSQGARTINDAFVSLVERLRKEYDLQIIFQTGKKNFERVIEQLIRIYPGYEADNNLLVKPYFEDMVTILKASDIAVSRAGSLSISEIEAAGLASILIPYPHAAADHQRKNAKFMVNMEASLYLEDSETDETRLGEKITFLLDNPEKLHELQNNALRLAKYDGVQQIVEQIKDISA